MWSFWLFRFISRKTFPAPCGTCARMRDPADCGLTIYDYVDTRVGILDNYFRMRSYSYGVHPDLLLNGQKENPDPGR